MKSETKNKNIFARMAVMLIALMLTSATVQATTYIKDVMLIGGSESEVNSLKTTYQNQGWTVIDQNLNAGCGSSSDHIYLLCKYENSNGANFGFVSDLYISTASGTAPDTRTVTNRTFYLVPFDGGSHFKEKKGDLNSNAGGADIHLYYSKVPSNTSRYFTSIYFTNTKDSDDGALGSDSDGWGTGYDLNRKAGGDYIYLHATTATAITYTVTLNQGIGLKNDVEPITRTSGDPSNIADSKSAAQNLQFYNDNGSIGFYLSEYYNPCSSNQKDGYTFLGWDFTDNTYYHTLTAVQTTYTAQWYGWLHDGYTISGLECSDFSKNSITSISIPAKIGSNTISCINIGSDNTIADNLPRLEILSVPNTVNSVERQPFAGCSNLREIWFTSTEPIKFREGSFRELSAQFNVYCYSPMPLDFFYGVYLYSPNVMFVFTDGFCGWCGGDNNQNELYWKMTKDGYLTFYSKSPNASIKSHSWSNGYASYPKKVYLSSGITGIGAETFKNNGGLAELYYEGTKAEWDAVTKGTDWKSGVASNFKEYWRCTVTFDTNGRGTAPQAQTKIWRDKDKAVKPSVATDEGYEVVGWYTDAACTTRWDFNTVVTADTTLYAKWGRQIHNTSNNDLTEWDGEMRDVTLDGRVLYMDDSWNTLCLPFSLSNLDSTPLAGFTIMELDTETEHKGHVTGFDNGTLYLNFKNATSIQAGKPYIVKKKEVKDISYHVNSASGNNPANLFDGTGQYWKSGDEYLWFRPIEEGMYVGKPWYVEFNVSSPVWVTGYTMTGDTDSDRNPAIWTVKAKLNSSDPWITIDAQYYGLTEGELKSFSINPSKQGYYKYFRLDVEDNNSQRGLVHLAELSLLFPDQNIASPLFHDVTISSDAPTPVTSDDGKVSFVGSYSPMSLAANDVTKLYLGASNTLYYPSVAKKIGACRAIFSVAPGTANLARACVLNFIDEEEGEEEATEIRGITTSESSHAVKESDSKWYNLDGSELRNKPAKSGIYINNGKKIAIK